MYLLVSVVIRSTRASRSIRVSFFSFQHALELKIESKRLIKEGKVSIFSEFSVDVATELSLFLIKASVVLLGNIVAASVNSMMGSIYFGRKQFKNNVCCCFVIY